MSSGLLQVKNGGSPEVLVGRWSVALVGSTTAIDTKPTRVEIYIDGMYLQGD